MARWLQLMKTGTFTDRFNKAYTITKGNLDRIVANYNRDTNPAPLCVGHPDPLKAKIPTFGIVDALKVVGDKLLFRPANVVAEFSSLVSKGKFPDISAGLDAGLSHLRHIAMLSAERPAIEGLEPIAEFSTPADAGGIVSLDVSKSFDIAEFSAASTDWLVWKIKSIGRILRSLKNRQIETDGAEKADALINEYDLTALQDDPPENVNGPQFSHHTGGSPMEFEKLYTELKAAVDGILAKFAKPGIAEFSAHIDSVIAEKTTLSTENDTLKTENTTLKTKVGEFEQKVRGAEFGAFVETLITEGRVLPDQKAATVVMLETMHKATPAEFSSANGAKSPLDLYKEELKARPVVAPKPGARAQGAEFSAADGSVDGVELGNQMRTYIDEQAAKGVTVNVIEAKKHILGR